MDKKINYTRGKGLLEEFLARKRSDKANSLILNSLRKGKILDIGCGSYPYFLLNTNFREKFGIDPVINSFLDDKNIKILKLKVDGKSMPFNNSQFDVITMLAVFEHIDSGKINFVLKEISRLLKDKGLLIITTPSSWADGLLHNMAKINLISQEEIHEHKTHYSKSQIEKIIKSGGFRNIKSGYFEIGMNMWFVAEK